MIAQVYSLTDSQQSMGFQQKFGQSIKLSTDYLYG